MDGLVTNVGLTYVRVETDDGPALLPNVLVLGAIVLDTPEQQERAIPDAKHTSGTPVKSAASGVNATSGAAANRGITAALSSDCSSARLPAISAQPARSGR
jgi:hypothetical protein